MAPTSDITTELVRTLTDPKPLYAVAGAGDRALQRLRTVPDLLLGASREDQRSGRTGARADENLRSASRRVQERLTEAVGGVQDLIVSGRLAEQVSNRVNAAANSVGRAANQENLRALPERAQHFAMNQVGRAAEAVARAGDTYDELAEHGRVVVERLRTSPTARRARGSTVRVEVVEPEQRRGRASSGSTPSNRRAGTSTAKARATRAAARSADAVDTAGGGARQRTAGDGTARSRSTKPRTVKPRAPKPTPPQSSAASGPSSAVSPGVSPSTPSHSSPSAAGPAPGHAADRPSTDS